MDLHNLSWKGLFSSLPIFLVFFPVTRTKHVEIDFHFVRDRVAAKALDVVWFKSGKDQLADVLTKSLASPRFQWLISKLNDIKTEDNPHMSETKITMKFSS